MLLWTWPTGMSAQDVAAVAVDDAFWVPGGAGGEAHAARRRFIGDTPSEWQPWRRRLKQRLVAHCVA